MATTTGGSTYVTSTDLVANYPTASLALANRVDVVASGSMSKKTASYTVTVADILAGTTIAMNSASATVITLPSSSLVNGMTLNVFSVNTGAVTFTGGTVTGTVNSISAQYTGVSLTYDSAAAVWWCLPFGGSVGAANFTNTATGTYTGYKYLTFTGNGSLTIDRAGFADILVIGGGGAGAAGGGGAGGHLYATSVYFGVGTFTCVVGAGGSSGSNYFTAVSQGNSSRLGDFYGVGGGANSAQVVNNAPGAPGGSGSGASGANAGGAGLSGQGNNGGTGLTTGAGGGGGAGAVGSNATTNTGGNGGAGLANSITGTSVTRAGGGGGSGQTTGSTGGTGGGGNGQGGSGTAATAGTANTGGGGGGGYGANAANGGSGIVIVRVAV